jgi:hypothetical protein
LRGNPEDPPELDVYADGHHYPQMVVVFYAEMNGEAFWTTSCSWWISLGFGVCDIQVLQNNQRLRKLSLFKGFRYAVQRFVEILDRVGKR